MTRAEAERSIMMVISQDANFRQAHEALSLLLGEIRDLELERNKLELDAAHWKERYEDAVRAIETVNTVTGQVR